MEGIASRYALALLKIAKEDHLQAMYLSRLQTLLTLLESDKSLVYFLGNAFYDVKAKHGLIDQTFPSTSWYDLGNFIKVLIQKRRVSALVDIIKTSITLLEADLKTQSGLVYTVTPLTAGQLQQLQQALSDYLHMPVTLTNAVDPSMLGGIRVDINGKVFDASLLSRLTRLRQTLMTRG